MWNDYLYEDYCGEQPKVNTGLTTQANDDEDEVNQYQVRLSDQRMTQFSNHSYAL